MNCFKCQSVNREGVKFCENCGTKITNTCPRCDSSIPIGKNFCGMCGKKLMKDETGKQAATINYDRPESYTPKFMAEKILTSRSSLEGERKLVTVFFSDVTGFTSLSETLDPETVHQIMDGCFKILMEEIHQYEGTINQFTGDGVMALFGAPLAHEDHAQRACHAAVSIQKSLIRYGRTVKNEYGVDFKMRVGLNSGPVVVGAIGDDLRMDYTAVGDTTNLAARLESMADPGSILISDSTYRLVNRYFLTENLGRVPVKGKKDPQMVYKLIKESTVISRLDASRARGLIKFIGRKDELKDLEKSLDRIMTGNGQIVGVVGEAGIGKSRFVLEMRNRTPHSFNYIESRCLQFNCNIPFSSVLESFKSFFDIGEAESQENSVEKLQGKLKVLDRQLMPFLPAFKNLLSLPVEDEGWERLEPKDKRDKSFEALRNFFVRLSQETPLILVFDDLQWIDKTSEEFIGYFIEWISNTKILLILLYRQEYTHSWGSKSFYRQIGIYALSEDESRQFIGRLLDDGAVSPKVEVLVLERTSGNPLFMEELIYVLVENKTIIKKGGQYQLNAKMSQHQVPDTIQGIIAGRMDRLEDNIKTTMQTASVIGRSFLFRLLQTLTGLNDEIKTYLMALQNLELIHEKRVFPELEYIFKNVITQEVAYNSLLLQHRKEIHGNIGRTIEKMYSTDLEKFYEILAHHFSKSDFHDSAFTYLKLSGDKAMGKNSAHEAFAFYQIAFRTIDHHVGIPDRNEKKIKILHAMMSPIILLNFPEESLDFLSKGVKISEQADDRKSLIRFYANLGTYHSVKGRIQEGIQFIEKAFDEACRMDDVTSMAQASPDLCLANIAIGQFGKVTHIASTMIHAIHKSEREQDNFGGPAVVLPTMYSISGFSLVHLGKFEEGLSQCQYGLEEAEDLENLFTKSLCRYYYGMALLVKGDWDKARMFLTECLGLIKQAEFVSVEILVKSALGVAETFLHDTVKGRSLAEDALKDFMETGSELQISNLKCNAGICCYQTGDFTKALSYMDQALENATKNRESFQKGKILIWRARILTRHTDSTLQELREQIEQALKIFSNLDVKPFTAMGHFFLAEACDTHNEKDEAESHFKQAGKLFKEMDMTYWLKG